jgi:two-component system chemotaxis response regulator CheB
VGSPAQERKVPFVPASTEPRSIDVIAIGASAGGLHGLRAIAAGLPTDLRATVLVVLHVAATGTSVLPQILGRSSHLEVRRGEDGLELTPGRIIVAPPDHHLVVRDGRACLSRGPRENGHRPAIDPLMRSVAEAYGPASAGVIISGTRDDGALGLADIKRAGGVAIVQDPEEAEYPGMPASAMASCDVDAVLPVAEIAPALAALARGEGAPAGADPPASGLGFPTGGTLVELTCPDCGGVLVEQDESGMMVFRCHVGHRYSPRSLLSLHADGVERAMWTAARSLEDRSLLLLRLADRARVVGNGRSAVQFERGAADATRQADTIRGAIAALDDDLTADVPDAEEIVE